ncbi:MULTISPECIES: aa3-type cytochrome oxidase subunit CtaJ [unclassified Geodermatophilus]
MTVVETLLVFLVAPLAVYVLLWALTYLPGGRKRQGVRYKPGQPWDHEPVWYEPQPANAPTHAAGQGDTQAVGSSLYGEPAAIGSGDGHGPGHGAGVATSHGATAAGSPDHGSTIGSHVIASDSSPAPAAVGPLGGARGTW